MLSEWSAECGEDDPVLVVPWASPDGELQWVDLRDNDDALDRIAEADEYPALLASLRALNAARSPVFTAKCDAWTMDADELEATRMDLMLDEEVAAAGFTSYIDLLWRDRSVFTSRHVLEGVLYRMDRALKDEPYSLAKVECVLRPALTDLDGTVAEGFAVTLYVKGVGVDETEALQRWSEALRAMATLVRSRESRATRAVL
ncbi:MAG: hypothetical protein ACRYF4_08330 [Janthinobacterium lividum]